MFHELHVLGMKADLWNGLRGVHSEAFFIHTILPRCQGRNLNTEKLFAYRTGLATPGITESWRLSSL